MNLNYFYLFLLITAIFIIQLIVGNKYIDNEYGKTKGIIIDVKSNKKQCSIIDNCKDRDYFGETCLNKTVNMKSGKCDNGYKCLKKITVGGSGGGSVKVCDMHLHHQLCFVNIYDCYDLYAKLEYKTEDNEKYYKTIDGSCNNLRNNTQCINNFKNDNKIGSSIQLYYKKDKPKKVYTKMKPYYYLYPIILLIDIIIIIYIARFANYI